MTNKAPTQPYRSLAIALAAAIFVACADQPLLAPQAEAALAAHSGSAQGTPAAAASGVPDLSACPDLRAPASSKLVFHVFAVGVQIYRWNGATWDFVAPEATLYANAAGNGVVGTHYAGPTWESNSGSNVVGTVLERCTPDASAIQWLLLAAVSSEGPGIFKRVDYIQRVNTVGGLAPNAAGTAAGDEVRVPYTTEYYFYRAR